MHEGPGLERAHNPFPKDELHSLSESSLPFGGTSAGEGFYVYLQPLPTFFPFLPSRHRGHLSHFRFVVIMAIQRTNDYAVKSRYDVYGLLGLCSELSSGLVSVLSRSVG